MKETITSPTMGTLMVVYFTDGDQVSAGDVILGIEVMKLIYDVYAGISGVIKYHANQHELIAEGQILAEIQG